MRGDEGWDKLADRQEVSGADGSAWSHDVKAGIKKLGQDRDVGVGMKDENLVARALERFCGFVLSHFPAMCPGCVIREAAPAVANTSLRKDYVRKRTLRTG